MTRDDRFENDVQNLNDFRAAFDKLSDEGTKNALNRLKVSGKFRWRCNRPGDYDVNYWEAVRLEADNRVSKDRQ